MGAGKKGILRSVSLVFSRFHEDGGPNMAAAISFYALMSLIPLLSLLVNIFAYFIGRSHYLRDTVVTYVKSLYPMLGDTLSREIDRLVAHTGLGWISLAVLLWLGSLVFSSLEFSFNTIFKAKKRRGFFGRTLLSFSMVIFSGFLMVASFGVLYMRKFLARHQGLMVQAYPLKYLADSIVFQVVPFILTFLSFTLLFKLLPYRKIGFGLAARGGLVAALLWEAAKHLFTWYVGGMAYVGVYGSLAAIIIFLLWIFYSSLIILLVAEMLHLMEQGELA